MCKIFNLFQNRSVKILVIANLVPIFGTVFFDWSLAAIMIMYWAENIVIGFYNILKMITAKGQQHRFYKGKNMGKISLIIFFIFHYGIFVFIHGAFISAIFVLQTIPQWSGIFLGIIMLFISHGYSYFSNFIIKKEYLSVSSQDLFIQPYSRVVILHITIIFAAFFVMLFGSPIVLLFILSILKIIVDIISHNIEHKKMQENFELRRG